ncbi:hypothetical protein VNO77_11121 [Canavalia gladiata]|uniref:Uncharacterized protein n=1 Tax=Canavalia gladiata TaxID=3824 RepID=A0AAN9MBT6_CANGL
MLPKHVTVGQDIKEKEKAKAGKRIMRPSLECIHIVLQSCESFTTLKLNTPFSTVMGFGAPMFPILQSILFCITILSIKNLV